ncbi:hypothetical protein IGI04_016336, partial [Brassica rapa subsp. trilocularis]
IQVKVGGKPVIVRVKRKVGHSLLDAFCKFLLSLYLDVKPKKVLLRHLETVTVDVIHSLFARQRFFVLVEHSCSKGKFEERKVALKKEETALDQSCTAATGSQLETCVIKSCTVSARQLHRMLSLSNWRSGNKELHERCSLFYDVIRVDAEEKPVCIFSSYSRLTSLEDQKLLASFLPLLRESIYMIGAVVPWSYYTLLCPRNRKSRKKLILDYI